MTINLRYPGQYYDRETGLFYNWNRYYDPSTGRYDSVDPVSAGEHVTIAFTQAQVSQILPLTGLGAGSPFSLNPMQMPSEFGTYSYVGDNPLDSSDPTGQGVILGGLCAAFDATEWVSMGQELEKLAEEEAQLLREIRQLQKVCYIDQMGTNDDLERLKELEKEYYDLTQQFALERLKQYGVTGAVAIGCAAATIEPFTGE